MGFQGCDFHGAHIETKDIFGNKRGEPLSRF